MLHSTLPLNFLSARSFRLDRLIIFVLAFSCQSVSANPLSLSEQQITNLGIQLTSVEPATELSSLQYPAKVTIPNAAQMVVNTVQSGVVTSLKVAEGDIVEQGHLLATVNSPELLQLQRSYIQALSELSHLQHKMERDKTLYEEGIIAERRFHEAKVTAQQQQTAVESYAKTLQLAGMSAEEINALAKTRVLDSKLSVYAPATGVVMKQYVIPGQHLNPAEPIYQIADLSRLWLEIHVPIKTAANVKPQDRVSICDKQLDAVVTTIGRQVHEIDQGVLVRAEVTENTDDLIPGEFVEVCFVNRAGEDRYNLPRSALYMQDGQSFIFISEHNQIQPIAVEVIADRADHAIVQVALPDNALVVTQGVVALKAAWLAENDR